VSDLQPPDDSAEVIDTLGLPEPDAPPAPSGGRIVLPVFEGPLDLLLHLVKVHEMDIYEIQIAEITRQYLDYLSAMTALDLEIAGDFLVMAATLLNIKSRSVLPRIEEDEETRPEDEQEIDEILSTQELIRRLVEYRKFKDLSARLRRKEEENAGVFYRAEILTMIPGSETELPRQDIRALYDAFVKVLKTVRSQPQHRVIRERFTVDEKMLELRERLRTTRQINLTREFEKCVHKEEVICFFLAILEMAKMREITVAQADVESDILIAPWDENVTYVG